MNTKLISQIAIGAGLLSLISILSLHFLSPQLDPRWHMVSEYAFLQYKWVLAVFFFSWAVSYWATAAALMPLGKHWLYRTGVFLLFVSGVGALMGGLFDVRHSLHGLAFALGIPFLPIVAPLMTRYLKRAHGAASSYATVTAHLTWITFLLMAGTMILFMSQMQAAGALASGTPELMLMLPAGVNSVIGYANRLLVVSYIGWLIAINAVVLSIRKK